MKRYVVSIGLFSLAVTAGFYVSILDAQMQGGKGQGGSQGPKLGQDVKPLAPIAPATAPAPAPVAAPTPAAPAPVSMSVVVATPATPVAPVTPAVQVGQGDAGKIAGNQGQGQGWGQGGNPANLGADQGLKLGQDKDKGKDTRKTAPALSQDQIKAGLTATVGQLFDYINKNNPAKSSNFLVLGDDKKSSFGAANKGFDQNWIKQNSDMSVTLQLDSAQEAATQGRDKKGPLLYFTANGVNLYLFDPWAPTIVKSLKSKK